MLRVGRPSTPVSPPPPRPDVAAIGCAAWLLEGGESSVALCSGRRGSARVILAATSSRVLCVSLPPDEDVRVRSFPIKRVMAVEERPSAHTAEVVLLTSHATIVLSQVERARAWEFCRAVRRAILDHAREERLSDA